MVCVADRNNGRIQCFDLDGQYIREMHPKGFDGTVYGIEYSQANGRFPCLNIYTTPNVTRNLELANKYIDNIYHVPF